MEDFTEGVGESSSPVRVSFAGVLDVRNEVYNRLKDNGSKEAASDSDFRDQLNAHFNRLPDRYALDLNMDRVGDVLLHQNLLGEAKDPDKRPVFCVRFMESIRTKPDGNDDIEQSTPVASTSGTCFNTEIEETQTSCRRNVKHEGHFEPCLKLGDLNLDVIRNDEGPERLHVMENLSGGQKLQHVHEIIFSTIDKPKLLSQLSTLLSDMGLNIREAHVFSTTDGFSLDVFVVDGWPSEDTKDLQKAVRKAVITSEGTWTGSSPHSVIEKTLADALKPGDWEIDRKMLQMGEMIASGSSGDLYRGTYLGNDVAVKVLKSEHQNDDMGVEFVQEIMMLREIQHSNIVRFIGACIKRPQFCIITEYMAGGSLYDHLRAHGTLELPVLLKFAIDVSKGMEYLHEKNIIHRDLKTANLLLDSQNVVKVADFGIARFIDGAMTAETGTYRWMAPEVLNHQKYNEKADVFSFGIVLWELTTAKLPYDTMTPLQAALGVREGLRPEVPDNVHPEVVDLMQRCWGADPASRPSFSGITLQLELMLLGI